MKGQGQGRAMAWWQWWMRTTVFPISCAVPSGCCRDRNPQPHGVGREPCREHAHQGIQPAPNLVLGGLLETLCWVAVASCSPAQKPHVPAVSSLFYSLHVPVFPSFWERRIME